MEILRPALLDEIVLEFLNERRALIEHYGEGIVPELSRLTTNVDHLDKEAAGRRKQILFGMRQPIFDELPKDIEWKLARIDRTDYDDLHVIRMPVWEEFTKYSGKVSTAARVYLGENPIEHLFKMVGARQMNAPFDTPTGIRPIFRLVEDHIDKIRNEVIPDIVSSMINYKYIIFTDSTSHKMALIEGNHRAIGVYLSQIIGNSRRLDSHEVFIGTSSQGCHWNDWP